MYNQNRIDTRSHYLVSPKALCISVGSREDHAYNAMHLPFAWKQIRVFTLVPNIVVPLIYLEATTNLHVSILPGIDMPKVDDAILCH